MMNAKRPRMARNMSWRCALALALAAPAAAAPALPDFTGIVERHASAVVKIIVEYPDAAARRGGGSGDWPNQLPDMFREFFGGRPDGPGGRPGAPGGRQRSSVGSGFIISTDGFMITNRHVVDGADKIVVRLHNRREHSAELVGSDARSDLALIRIDTDETLPYLPLGKPDALKVGEWVLAIGSPFDLDYSVAAGIVSAVGRSLPDGRENYTPFIQTDVAINPGNSGGPLFNLKGQVIGVNSQIYTQGGGSIGLSFAIPMSVVRKVVRQLRENGSVVRGWLGVVIQSVSQDLAESFDLARPTGALVSEIEPNGPADRAGMRPGDIIVAFAGRNIEQSADLPHVVGLLEPETQVWAKVMRDGKTRSMKVTVGALEGDENMSAAFRGDDRHGLVMTEIDAAMKRRLRIQSGLLIQEVLPSTPAAKSGFRPGDVITMAARGPVSSLADFDEIMESSQGRQRIAMRILRQGRASFMVLNLEK